MTVETEIAAVERHSESIANLPALRTRVSDSVDRATRVLERTGSSPAAKRQRAAFVGDVQSRLMKAGLAVAIVSAIAIGIGMIAPIGLFGFLAAVGLAIGLAAMALFWPASAPEAPTDTPKLDNGEMVRSFDRYMAAERRLLPAPAQKEVDAMLARLPELEKVLERVPSGDPQAVDARRLMSRHLPGLIDRYEQVPAGYRDTTDNEGLTVEERLTDGLKAGRKALEELGETLAKKDVSALETHGRFLKNRYGDKDEPLD
ncbi:hypothetical protein WJT74_02610 [Sphingomicrobium sp. XHP0239]|uniref:hypothetical protein n=1 Tax=Sphingomicrobium maritimum TaxID=3133972 RepID=UPI0031CC51F6